MSTQRERTEAAILAAYGLETAGQILGRIETHARDIAEKLDEILHELDGWDNATADAVRTIIDNQ